MRLRGEAEASTLLSPMAMNDKLRPGRRRIVVTGGPGAGKTTAVDLFRREIGDSVVVVPEAATLLFTGGFPRERHLAAQRASQRAIYHVQRNLEDAQRAMYPDRVLLCDRGTIDGAVYWPDGDRGFFADVGTTLEAELARYDAVVFFESAAAGGLCIEGGNRMRIEDAAEAARLDRELQQVWSRHPRYVLIGHTDSFLLKITAGLAVLRNVLRQLDVV
jgi:predicted ATPase